MKQLAMRVTSIFVVLLVGCAVPPPRPAVDPSLSPERIVLALSNRNSRHAEPQTISWVGVFQAISASS